MDRCPWRPPGIRPVPDFPEEGHERQALSIYIWEYMPMCISLSLSVEKIKGFHLMIKQARNPGKLKNPHESNLFPPFQLNTTPQVGISLWNTAMAWPALGPLSTPPCVPSPTTLPV